MKIPTAHFRAFGQWLDRLWQLCRMRMSASGIYFQPWQYERLAQSIFRKHSDDCLSQDFRRFALVHEIRRSFFQSTRMPRVPSIQFILPFLPSEFYVRSINDNHIVAHVMIGLKCGLVLMGSLA